MRYRIAAVAILLLAGACTATIVNQGITPRFTVNRMRAAVDDHSLRTFERYVDTYALARQFDEAFPRDIRRPNLPHVSLNIPVGTFAPQLLRQIEGYVSAGQRPSPGVARVLDTIQDGDIAAINENANGTRTVVFRAGVEEIALVMTRDGAIWRVTGFENLKLPEPPGAASGH